MYAAHKAAGGMTSIYRQIGIGSQWLLNQILQDYLGLNKEQATWSYMVPSGKGERRLSLDGRIELEHITDARARGRVQNWLWNATQSVGLPPEAGKRLKGAVIEARQGYKSKDSKRQNADVSNAANAYVHDYLPVVLLFSTQIDFDVAVRYKAAHWLLLNGSTGGTALDSSYVFCRDVVGYDLAAFFARNAPRLRQETDLVLQSLLSA